MQTVHSTKQCVGIIFGGQSGEHDVSVQSARSVLAALDTSLFDTLLIKITPSGAWHAVRSIDDKPTAQNNVRLDFAQGQFITANGDKLQATIMFPLVHGPRGEDGTLQGLLELLGLPYVGCGVLASAIGMDKDITKRLLKAAGIPIAPFVTVTVAEACQPERLIKTLGLPLFVKPANMGSSVGVSKVTSKAELLPAIAKALQHDKKVVIESTINGSEIECAVMGNSAPKVSLPGRIKFTEDFYTYNAKYSGASGTQLEIPAVLSPDMQAAVQKMALAVYAVLECRGLARVDMFVTETGKIIVNEINTMPGFTQFSMYPQLWLASGLNYTQLLTELLMLATEN